MDNGEETVIPAPAHTHGTLICGCGRVLLTCGCFGPKRVIESADPCVHTPDPASSPDPDLEGWR